MAASCSAAALPELSSSGSYEGSGAEVTTASRRARDWPPSSDGYDVLVNATPVKEELISKRVAEIKARGAVVCGSLTPQKVRDHYEAAVEAGLDILVIQGTVISAEHVSTTVEPLNLKEFIAEVPVPTVVGGPYEYGVPGAVHGIFQPAGEEARPPTPVAAGESSRE